MKKPSHKQAVPAANPQMDIPSGQIPQNMEEEAWISVIHQMESIYTDLVRYQVELEEKNAELENAQRFINSVISSMSDILIVCDVNGKIQQVNLALEKAINKSENELIGTTLVSLFTEQYSAQVSEFSEYIRSQAIIDCEVDLLDSDNSPVPMAVNCNARYDHNNRLCGLVVTGRPLGELRKAYAQLNQAHAELKTAQKQLIQSEKMASLGRLVAGVAHELNNPISIVYGNMYALQRYQKRFEDYINSIQQLVNQEEQIKLRKQLRVDPMLRDIGPLIEGSMEGAERVNEIVQNLRRFSIPQQQNRVSFNLFKVCNTAVQWVLRSSKLKPELKIDIPQDLELINHEGYVHQILINLLQNAVDAMEKRSQPVLMIDAMIDGKSVSLRIRDNGPGIAENDLLKIFDPFFTRKVVGKGTGLGLYISYGLATEQCGGGLKVENHPEGGAQFTLDLPLEREL